MREFKLEVKRDSIAAELFVHSDNIIEITSPDSNVHADYLIRKQLILKDLYTWARAHGVVSFEFNKVP